MAGNAQLQLRPLDEDLLHAAQIALGLRAQLRGARPETHGIKQRQRVRGAVLVVPSVGRFRLIWRQIHGIRHAVAIVVEVRRPVLVLEAVHVLSRPRRGVREIGYAVFIRVLPDDELEVCLGNGECFGGLCRGCALVDLVLDAAQRRVELGVQDRRRRDGLVAVQFQVPRLQFREPLAARLEGFGIPRPAHALV